MSRTATHPSLSPWQLLLPNKNAQAVSFFNTPGLELTPNARSALYRAALEIRSEQRDEVLAPAFHCPSGIMPFLAAGMNVTYYRIRPDLSVDIADLLSKVGPRTAAVVVIHFFGHRTPLDCLLPLQDSGIKLIEDWSHSFLDRSGLRLNGHPSAYRIYSFWKLLPSGTGGGLLRPKGHQSTGTHLKPEALKATLVDWKRMIEDSIQAKGNRVTRLLFNSLEAVRLSLKLPRAAGNAASPQETAYLEEGEHHYEFDASHALTRTPARIKRWMQSCDLQAIARIRIQNHDLLAKRLQDHPLIRPAYAAPPDATPWVFPVFVENRDQRDRSWSQQGVALHTFGRYLHSGLFKQGGAEMIRDARHLASNLLCLSVHQDLGPAQMDWALKVLTSSR